MNDNWKTRKLGDVISLEYGKPLPKDQRCSDKGYPAYGANGVKTRALKPYWNEPSIIVGRKGTAGAVNLVEGGFWPLDVTYYVTFDSSEYDLKFLFYTLSSFNLPSFATGVKPGINRNLVYAIEQKFPALAEQKRIVAILDEAFDGIDAAIANTEKNLANARELFESYLNSTFNDPNHEWNQTDIGALCERVTKGSSPKWQGINYVDEPGILFVTSENVGENELLFNKTKYVEEKFNKKDFKSILKKGDVLTNIVGASIGRTAVFDRDDLANINQAVCLMRCDPERLFNYYLAYLLNSPFFKSVLHENEIDNARANLSLGFFKNLRIPVPPIDKQVCIVSKIDERREKVQLLESVYQQKLIALKELKQSLLQKAFSGELTANNVVEITAQKQPKTSIDTNSPEFAAHIMAAAYHWHASQSREKTFGRVKAQKTLHLVESLANIDLGRQPIKDAAGPNDFQHMQRAEDWARDSGFFEFVKRPTGQRGYDFRKGARYGDLVAEAMQALVPYENVLKRVVKVLMPLNTAETEILATVYAAWNNLLLEGIEPTEIAIIHEARENWHADKLKYSEEQFRNAISQLRQNGLVPQGRGKRVTGQESLAL
ncbi:restriction endonuclease subunit S [Vreelandella titanicae]|uniref:restriction endonuclease subunit S n=1 Tax=Vreelandella titanicae TaxID=664683 RepID=UPI003818A40C